MSFNLREIQRHQLIDDQKQKIVAKKILEQCFKRIKSIAEKKGTECIYDVPMMVYGEPLYNQEYVCSYLFSKLKKKGLKVKLINNCQLHIDWKIKKSKKPKKKKPLTALEKLKLKANKLNSIKK